MKKIFAVVLLFCLALSGAAFAAERAVVKSQIAPVLSAPGTSGTERIDEVLFGMVVEVMDASNPGYARVRTAYGLEGYIPQDDLRVNDADAAVWLSKVNYRVSFPHADIHTNNGSGGNPSQGSNGRMLGWLPKGALINVIGPATADYYYSINMPSWVTFTDGPRESPGANTANRYIRSHGSAASKPDAYADRFTPARFVNQNMTEPQFRDAIVADALSYCCYTDTFANITDADRRTLGTMAAPWRSGGKTHQGMDASGLVHMVYLLNDSLIPRDAVPASDGALRVIDSGSAAEGDILCWNAEDGRGIYIGNDQFVFASMEDQKVRIGKIGVDIQRQDIVAWGSVFFTEATGVTLDVTAKDIAIGDSFVVNATVTPAGASTGGLEWSSSDPLVAAVSATGGSAVVTAVSGGAAVIMVTTPGGAGAGCIVAVAGGAVSGGGSGGCNAGYGLFALALAACAPFILRKKK